MRGYNHALSGAASWLALTSSSTAGLGYFDYSSTVVATGAVVCAGAALKPDLDHTQGTIAWSMPSISVGPITLVPSPTRALCGAVSAISGGHRQGTHSLIGIAVFWLLTKAASGLTLPIAGRDIAIASTVLICLNIAFASKAVGLSRVLVGRRGSVYSALMRSWLGPWLVALGGAGALTWYYESAWDWLPYAIGVGVFIHCVGDSLTTGGVPWLWPWKPAPPDALQKIPILGAVILWVWRPNGFFGIPLLGNTTSGRERFLGVLMTVYIVYLSLFEVTEASGLAHSLF